MRFQSEDARSGASLLLRLGDRRYRVTGAAGWEVAPAPVAAPVPVPAASPWLRGVAVHKDEALALVDLARALDGASAGPSERMLVTRDTGLTVGFLVDDVDGDDGREEAETLDLRGLGRELLARAALWAPVP